MKNIEIFKRIEQKYVLSEDEYNKLMNLVKNHLNKDEYYKSNICNIYFDNDNYDLIINSLEKGYYKEKVRLRSYSVPKLNDKVYFEIKSKFDGIVYKRRVILNLSDYYDYLDGKSINSSNKQIMDEIDYIIKKYNLKPKYFVAYDRLSYYDKDDKSFRVTFDENIRSRKDELRLEYGDSGNLFFSDKMYVMELKSNGGLPVYFIDALSKLKIYPSSFSKIGNVYKKEENYV